MKLAGLLAAITLVISAEARATFFKYKDSSGAVVITDKLENIPKQYRNQLKVIWDEDLEARDPLKKRWATAREAREKQEREGAKRDAAANKKSDEGKRIVITVDEATGQLIRTLE